MDRKNLYMEDLLVGAEVEPSFRQPRIPLNQDDTPVRSYPSTLGVYVLSLTTRSPPCPSAR